MVDIEQFKISILTDLSDVISDEHHAGMYDSEYIVDIIESIRSRYVDMYADRLYDSVSVHTAYDVELVEKVNKIKSLISGGVGGERENAERALDRLMKQKGMTDLSKLNGYDKDEEDFIERLIFKCVPSYYNISIYSKQEQKIIAFFSICGINEAIKGYCVGKYAPKFNVVDDIIFGYYGDDKDEGYRIHRAVSEMFKCADATRIDNVCNNIYWTSMRMTYLDLIYDMCADNTNVCDVKEPEVVTEPSTPRFEIPEHLKPVKKRKSGLFGWIENKIFG